MLLNMIGSDHIYEGKNKQDMAFQLENMKIVMDGCGSGRYSEVGATLFMLYITKEIESLNKAKNRLPNHEIITDMIEEFFKNIFGDGENYYSFLYSDDIIYNTFLFTILVCIETETEFIVFSAGDGFILTLDSEDRFGMQELDAVNEYPAYYAYNFIHNKEAMYEFKDGVKIEERHFSKEQYKKVGVASDGIRYVRDLFSNERELFNSYIIANRTGKAEMFVKQHQNGLRLYNKKGEEKPNIFKDDISIVF